MQKTTTPILIVALILIGICIFSMFEVYQSQRALVIRLGEFVKEDSDSGAKVKILEPGLHIKMPFIDKVVFFDARLQTSDIPAGRIVTNEKKDLMVDLFIEWKIEDYALFYQKTKVVSADIFLRQNVVDILRSEFGQRTIKEVVSGDRQTLLSKLMSGTAANAQSAGMKVIDIRIKRIDYPQVVNEAVYERMRSDRKGDATKLRAQGLKEAERIRSEADNKVRIILAKSEMEAQKIKGQGEANAAQVFAESYGKAPDFFDFYGSLKAYRNIFQSETDIFVLRPDSEFFKYLKNKGTTKDMKES